jgi:hypothetical protein
MSPTATQRSILTNPRRVNYGKLVELASRPEENGTTLERVNVNDVVVPDYQRLVRIPKLRKMIDAWNPNLAGWIILSRHANGGLYVIDGQHRIEAVRHLQGTISPYLDAIIVNDWTSTQEAEFFAGTQAPENRAALKPEDIHHALVLAGDERAIDLQRTVQDAGFRIGDRSTDGVETGRLRAVAAINKVYDQYGGSHLSETLTVIHSAWGTHCQPEQSVVTGVALFLAMYPQVDPQLLPARIGKMPLPEWLMAAKSHARTERLTANEGVAYKIRVDFNYKRQEHTKLPDFLDTLRAHRSAIRAQAGRQKVAKYGLSGAAKMNAERKTGR